MEDIYRSQFRLPYSLYEQLKESADNNHRSVNAELVARLEESFSPDMTGFIRTKIAPLEKGPALELESVKLNLQIILEQLNHIQQAQAAAESIQKNEK